MACSGDIRAYIDSLPDDAIVTSRDLLEFGLRNTIDKAVSRLVDLEVLIRVARGVFIKNGASEPSPMQCAIVKAKAFGKELVSHGQEIARELRLAGTDVEAQLVYQVKGRTSSFLFMDQRILMRGVVAKKMFGGETMVGKVIRALSFLGRDMEKEQFVGAIAKLDPNEHYMLIKAARWMSWWLADAVRKFLFSRPPSRRTIKTLAS